MSKTSQAEKFRSEGNQHLKNNRLNEALESYSKAITINSDDCISYSNRAKVYNDLGQYENALNDSNNSISRDKTFWKGYHGKATSLMMLNRFEEALSVCSEALNLPSSEGFDTMNQLKELINFRSVEDPSSSSLEKKVSLEYREPVKKTVIKKTVWDDLSEADFQKKMKEVLQDFTKYIACSEVPVDLKDFLDETMVDQKVMTRFSKTNMDLEWYELLYKPKIAEEPLIIVLTMLSNIFLYMNNSKKSKIKTSPQLKTLFGKLLFSKDRMNNLQLLASATWCMRHLFVDTFVGTVIKFPGGSYGALRNNALVLLIGEDEKLQAFGATLFHDITNNLNGKKELVYHHASRLKSVDGFKIIVSLLTKHLNSGFNTLPANGAEVLFDILGFSAWDLPKEILDSGAIEVAAKYIDHLQHVDTNTAQKALSVFFGVLQNVNTSKRRRIERTCKLYDRLKVLLRDGWSRGSEFINYTIRSIAFVTDFKNCGQDEKELVLSLTIKALQHFIPPGSRNLNEGQIALGRHAALILSSGCSDAKSAKFILDTTISGLEYYAGICNKAPFRLQQNFVSTIAVLMAHSDVLNNPMLMSGKEFMIFLNWVTKNANGNDPQLQYICMYVVNVIGSLSQGVVPNIAIEEETDESTSGVANIPQPASCAFCATRPCKTKCGDCKQTHYCCKECQMGDWNFHKLRCKKV